MQRIILVFLFFLSIPLWGTSRNDDIKFDNYTIDQGLSQSTVNCIIQDERGFIWVGTQDGLNRFDGYQFKSFKHNPEDPTSLTNSFINALYEDESGNIWIGTDNGLNRFNPVTQEFERYLATTVSDTTLGDDRILSLEGAKDGRIWVGTANGGLYRFHPDADRFERLPFDPSGKNGIPSNTIRTVFQRGAGELWIGTGGKGVSLYSLNSGDFQLFDSTGDTSSVELASDEIWNITGGKDENIWIGTNGGLTHLYSGKDGYSSKNYGKEEGLPHEVIRQVFIDKKGKLWIGTNGGGLACIESLQDDSLVFSSYQHSYYEENTLANNIVFSVFEDRTGSIWVGTRRGLSKFDKGKQNFKHLTYHVDRPYGLNDKSVWSIFHDHEENVIWIGTSKGLNRFDRKNDEFSYLQLEDSPGEGGNNHIILSILEDREDRLWVGSADGLYRVKGYDTPEQAEFVKIEYRDPGSRGIETNRVYTLLEDESGLIWIGTRDGLSRLNPENGEYEFFRHDPFRENSLSHNTVRDLHQDESGTIWVATDGGGLNRINKLDTDTGAVYLFDQFLNSETGDQSLTRMMVHSIWEGTKGNLWLGTYGGGLVKFHKKTGEVSSFTQKDGLPNNVVYGVLGDDAGNLWLSTNHGLSKFSISEKRFQNFAKKDGIQSNEFNTGAYHKSPEGFLFFGGINGLNIFRSEAIQPNPYPPQVVLTEFYLFNEIVYPGEKGVMDNHISLEDKVFLSHDMDNFSIQFAALHYSYAENNRYKYIMEGFDKDTVHAGTRRTVHYTNLDPGVYTFKVFGSNSDGVWSEEPATLRIIVEPPFWATWWFRGLVLIALLGGVFGLYRYRVSLIKAQKRKLEVEVQKRTGQILQQKEKIEEQNRLLEKEKKNVEEQKVLLQGEKEKVDKLLVNILPEDTANELKTGGKASARHYGLASVMFTDFKGFTQIAEKVEPNELLARLDSYFIQFDKIIEKYELEKIKTIGDSYMAVGGIPIRNKTNPIHTTLAGLEIQRFMLEQKEKLKDRDDEVWKLRIGIHTGELIAGVIGIKRYAYDVWGDTVNVASRMESSGEAGKVNISGETYQWIEPYFDCTYRGKVLAKNKGHIDMFFVEGIKPELSENREGKVPNRDFWDYVNLHFFSKISYQKAEKHLLRLLEEKLPKNLFYHDIDHTRDVCQAVERLAFMEGIKGEDLFLLKTAALYHDAGFVERYDRNEEIGVRMARENLPKFGYTPEQIEIVARLILATEVPHKPGSHLEEIICDADLDYLGRDDFYEIADSLKRELMDRGKVKSEREWDELQVKFLNMHKYFTPSSIKLRREKKLQHLHVIENKLKNGGYEDE